MRFGVLGPLAGWTDDGVPVRIPELKVRVLLAHLLVREGRAVATSRLIADLWPESLPRDPRNALQLRVSQLRRALEAAEPGARDLIVRQPPGYLLHADVDADRFRRLLTLAHRADDLRTRSVLLADALALWRGPAYADFADEPFARAAVDRLEEERLTALEDQAELRLALGEHYLLVGELGDLVGLHPHRQRLRASYLLALYRAGRHSEALASYAELRQQLADDLGLDPSAELVDLQQAILRQDPALQATAASVTSAARRRSNLPASLSKLIGRETATDQVVALVKHHRLVSLTGPGGVGKSRLATEAARRMADDFENGAWLIELAELDRADGPRSAASMTGLVAAITTTLGIRDQPSVDHLAEALTDQHVLLVLDNCEHIVATVAALVEKLLRRAPELHVLTTSQESLAIAGEQICPVPPLELPSAAAAASDLVRASAVRLFAARAAAAAPGFKLGPGNVQAVAGICRRLDGLPLALELAATRLRALGLDELSVRLDDRFGLLAAGRRDGPARQRTLRAMVDWSWELLTDRERLVLRRLSVHAGGCTLEAAEAVCGDAVADELARLVDRSLVSVLDGPRYRLLETVKQYGTERLTEAGESETTQRRMVQWYTALAERAEPRLYGHDQRVWLERLDLETPNLRAALDTAIQYGDSEHALRIVDALAWYWFLRGRLAEASRSFDLALSLDGNSVAAERVVAWQAGIRLLGDDGSRHDAARTLLASDSRIRAHWFLGFAHRGGPIAVTAEVVDRALAEYRTRGDLWGVAAAQSVRATLGRASGDLATAERDAMESEAIFRELGDRWGRLKATNSLAELAEIAGDYPRAERLHRDGLRAAEELGLWGEVSLRLSGLGRIALLQGDFAVAEEFHTRAMRLAAELSNKPAEEFAELGLGLGARRQGKLDVAEKHLRRWLDWLRQLDSQPGVALVLAELGFIAEQRGDARTALELQAEGLAAARAIGDPRALALALEGLAGAYAVCGDEIRAARLLGAASARRASVGAPLPAAERGDVDRITDLAQQALGAETFAVAFRAGTTDPLP
ncbi:MAG TPA: BTAD domain-containing putative transcriptional regulator [Kribbella sp.]|nr:BTAD domain-containing putative transcriptional regulator [Kribbella sp.]